MRVPTLVMSLLAAVPCAAAVQAATVVSPEATVSGVTVTNTGTYKAQSVSAPSGAGQLSPTGTIGTTSNWHFVSKTSEVAGEVGTQFGIEFRLEGNPVGDTVTTGAQGRHVAQQKWWEQHVKRHGTLSLLAGNRRVLVPAEHANAVADPTFVQRQRSESS
jgi:hypothetical protein